MVSSIAVFSGKGGVGKTTISIALAQYTGKVLIDADPQCSATDWADMRSGGSPTVISAQLNRVPKLLEQHPQVIIDTPGAIAGNIQTALREVSLILLVTGDRQFELNALSQSVDMGISVGKPVVVLLNRLHPFTDPAPIREAIQGLDVEVCPIVIRERSAHYKSLVHGQTAAEYEPEGAAATEIAQLCQWLEARG
mgnify:CR=1 FL=1